MTGKKGSYFEVGQIILYGKYKNKKGIIKSFGDDGKGNPTVEIEPIPKGKKKNKTMGLFRIWRQKNVEKSAKNVAERYLNNCMALRVAARSKEAVTYDDTKINELLLAARKRSTGKLESLAKIQAMLDYLGGWRVEPFVGLSQIHLDGHDRDATEYSGNLDEIEVKLKKLEVKALPANPKVDVPYVQKVERVQKGKRDYIKYLLWIGAAGVRFTSPDGKVYELLPDYYSFDGGSASTLPWDMKKLGKRNGKYLKRMLMYFFKWLYKETKFMDQVLEALQMPSLEEERERKNQIRTQDNTGTCSCCFRNIKLKETNGKKRMADHGYQRPGTGYITGQCFGVPFPPFELSDEGTKAYVKEINEMVQSALGKIRDLESGKTKELRIQWGGANSEVKTYVEGDKMWRQAKEKTIGQLRDRISYDQLLMTELKKAISQWKPRDLPKEGEIYKPPFRLFV